MDYDNAFDDLAIAFLMGIGAMVGLVISFLLWLVLLSLSITHPVWVYFVVIAISTVIGGVIGYLDSKA